MNPILGAFLILAALSATYWFARAGIHDATIITTVLAAGVTLLQAKTHAATNAELAALSAKAKAAALPGTP